MQTSRSVARDFFGAAHIMKIYGHIKSGNCYKVYLTAELLGLRYDWITLDNSKGETHTAEFLAIHPNGKVPAMVLPDGRRLAESNAIIAFLADGSHLIPQDRFEYAQMLQWMFFEQYSHEPYIAVARFIQFYQNMPAERQAEYDTCQIKSNATLRLMDHQRAPISLERRCPWLILPCLPIPMLRIKAGSIYPNSRISKIGSNGSKPHQNLRQCCLTIDIFRPLLPHARTRGQ